MRTALSLFTRADDARQAADRLKQQSIDGTEISVHDRPAIADPSSSSAIDQAASGGLFTDFYWLLQNLFGSSNGEVVRNLADGVPEGGSVVVVRARSDDDAARAQAFLRTCGAASQYHVPREGDLG
jgi:hypothetical protein